jgi:hypothetical protein
VNRLLFLLSLGALFAPPPDARPAGRTDTDRPVRETRVGPPRVIGRFPDSAATVATPWQTVNMTFDETLDSASITTQHFSVVKAGGGALQESLHYYEGSGMGGVNIDFTPPLETGASYTVRVSGVRDTSGNAMPDSLPVTWTFSIQAPARVTSVIDPFNAPPFSWKQPMTDRNTTGVDSASFSFMPGHGAPAIQGNPGAAAIAFIWDTSASSWLLRVPLDTLAPQKTLVWQKLGTVLEAYVFGDGGASQFRFGVEDSVDIYPEGRPRNHKVSRWYPLTWVGWRLLEWDLANDTVGVWLGSPTLGGQIRFDSFQLRYLPGKSARRGTVDVDQLQIAKEVIVSVTPPPAGVPVRYGLDQNFPNPFNPSTVFVYRLPADSRVTINVYDVLGRLLATLVEGFVPAGSHAVTWNASSCASGVYFARLVASDPGGGIRYVGTVKVGLMK